MYPGHYEQYKSPSLKFSHLFRQDVCLVQYLRVLVLYCTAYLGVFSKYLGGFKFRASFQNFRTFFIVRLFSTCCNTFRKLFLDLLIPDFVLLGCLYVILLALLTFYMTFTFPLYCHILVCCFQFSIFFTGVLGLCQGLFITVVPYLYHNFRRSQITEYGYLLYNLDRFQLECFLSIDAKGLVKYMFGNMVYLVAK